MLIADQKLFDDVYGLAESSSWFDASQFLDDVHAQFRKRGFITDNQRDTLIRIRNRLAEESE